MGLKTNVYIGDVTNLTEARYYAGMGVSILGFNTNPETSTFTSTEKFQAITAWLSGVQTAWQWKGEPSQTLWDLVQENPSDFIELSAIPKPEFLKYLSKPILLRTSNKNHLEEISKLPQNTIEAIVWEGELTFTSFPKHIPVYIQVEHNLTTTEVILEHANGLALHGNPESRPGWNDFDQLAELLESLETN